MSRTQPDCSDAVLLAAAPPRTVAARQILLGVNILGLDAPLVALLWQDFFAWNLGVKLGAAPRVILGLAVWLAYAADRWLDGWKIPPGAAITPRHRFAQRHRAALAWVWCVVLLVAVALSWFGLSSFLFQRGLWLMGGVLIYLLLNQWPKTTRWLRGFKEVAVALLFAAGTTIFFPPDEIPSLRPAWQPVAGWGLLCFLNCYAIACWEREQDRAENQESLVTRWPWLAGAFKSAALLLVMFALVPALARPAMNPPRIRLAVASSALTLALLDYWSKSIETNLLRALADLALLTPLFFRF
jgi:hypothetical protein